MTNTDTKNTSTKNTNMIKRPGRGPMWKWGLIRVQHRLEPKARKPRSQPWQRRITKWILRDNEQLSCDSELAFFSWPDTPMTGMLPCLVLSAAIIAMSGKPEVSSFFTVVFTFWRNKYLNRWSRNNLSALPCPCARTLKQEDLVVGRTSVVALYILVICYTTALWVCTVHYSWVGHCHAH